MLRGTSLNVIVMERLESRCLQELRALLLKANDLYECCLIHPGNGDPDEPDKAKKDSQSDAIKLLDTIGELENKIRIEEYKEDLLNGEV